MRRRSSTAALARSLLYAGALRYVAIGVLCLVASGLSALSLLARARRAGVSMAGVSVADGLLWLTQGNPAFLWAGWAAPWVLVLAACVLDARGLARGSGAARFVLGGSRARGWAACCAAAVASSLAAYVALVAGSALWVVLLGGRPTLEPASIEQLALFGMEPSTTADVLDLLALMALGAAALALLQLAACLWVGPAFAFLAVVALLVASALLPEIPLLGSWLGPAHVEPFSMAQEGWYGAWSMAVGALVYALVAVLSVVLGARRFLGADLGLGGGSR